MWFKQRIITIAMVILSVFCTPLWALDSPEEQLVYQPSSMWNGNFYTTLFGAYTRMFFTLKNPSNNAAPLSHSHQRPDGYDVGGEIGYMFDHDYFAPIRAAILILYRPSIRFHMLPMDTANTINARGTLSSTEVLLNLYYDFYTDVLDGFHPYFGGGFGFSNTQTKFRTWSVATGNPLSTDETRTNAHFAWNVVLGVTNNITDHIDFDVFVRLNLLGKADFHTRPVGSTNTVQALTTSSLYSLDLGAGIRYDIP